MYLRRLLLFLGLTIVPLTVALAQDARVDSSSFAIDEKEYYNIIRTRLVRWLRENQKTISLPLLKQVASLVEDADHFAGEGDYGTALVFLDTATDITKTLTADATSQKAATITTPTDAQIASFSLLPQVITGIDLWRQQFELAYAGDSSDYHDSSGNPFVGVRLRGSYESDRLGSLETFVQLKTSRDYNNGELEIRGRGGKSTSNHWLFENRLETTRYKNTLDLRYWENATNLKVGLELARNFVVLAGDDFRLRRYENESRYYPSYVQNFAETGFQYTSGLSTRLAGSYAFGLRRHLNYAEDDYHEHLIEASAYQVTALNSSIYFENIWRQRTYARGYSDSSYQNSFQEEFLRGDFRFGLTRNISFDLQSDFTLRQYQIASAFTPDYVHVDANPRFLFRVYGDWQIGLGYLYVLRVYKKDIVKTSAQPTTVAASDQYLGYEDYFSHGVSLSLELFRLGKFMLSLTNQLELRTYPNSTTNTVPGFGFYTDREINSLLLFLSWTVLPKLELGVLANYDNDRSREDNHSDSRNTLFSIDLGYSF